MNIIETENLYIRKFKYDDYEDLYEYLSDYEVVKFEPYEPFTLEQCKKEAISRAKSENFYAVCLKENNKLIGNLFFAKNNNDFNTWEIGYVFNKNYHRQGYGSESTLSLIQFLFSNKNARRILAECDPLNIASWQLLENIGMNREAHFKKNIYFKKDINGNPIWKDTYVYAILKEN